MTPDGARAFHKIRCPSAIRCKIRSGRNFFTAAGWFLGRVEDRLYPFRTDNGGTLNVQSDLGVRVGLAAMRGCPCGWYGIPTPPVLSAVLSAGRAARNRSRTASLQW